MEINQIIDFEHIYDSMMKCKANVILKDSVASFYLNGIEKSITLSDQLLDGTYRPRKPMKFVITSPKRREIISTSFRDRVYQRTLNDLAIYPEMTRSFIYDNWACQKGKGTDKARECLKEFLHKEYRHYGNKGYCLKIDIKGYYPHMSHKYVEGLFLKALDEEIGNRAVKILSEQYDGDIGYNPGSQLVQIAGITALNNFDHWIKEALRIKYYLRYMDDIIIIYHDKTQLQEYLEDIERRLSTYGFSLNEKKTKIYKLEDGFEFLGFKFRLTESGKVLMNINPENVKRERKKLRRAANLVKKGVLTEVKFTKMYRAWKAHAMKGNNYKVIQRMDKLYKTLLEEIEMNFRKENMDVPEAVALENTKAKNAKLQADLDYIAMMTDVEIPEEEEHESFTEI